MKAYAFVVVKHMEPTWETINIYKDKLLDYRILYNNEKIITISSSNGPRIYILIFRKFAPKKKFAFACKRSEYLKALLLLSNESVCVLIKPSKNPMQLKIYS